MPKLMQNAKRRILDATKLILAEQKDGDFTMRDVARKCGFALGTLYNYYAGKAELIVEIVAEMWDNCFDEIRKVEEADFYDCIAKVNGILHKYMQCFTADLMGSLSSLSDEGKMLSKEFNERYIGTFKELLSGIIAGHTDQFDKQVFTVLTLSDLTDFILGHLLSLVSRETGDYGKFDFMLRRLLN